MVLQKHLSAIYECIVISENCGRTISEISEACQLAKLTCYKAVSILKNEKKIYGRLIGQTYLWFANNESQKNGSQKTSG